ncbi:hypothetical protein BD626DRAFT_629079 [Schizophyllum amplum]|uniref:Uncharacterized protein n=1 Tax=Schizophyllum amplum TaxID=97359 RepID=A0A550CJM5_9AGAR|nr:hypothetical protein BD626DRAFT_629079 [Auriculariopsis ampla]
MSDYQPLDIVDEKLPPSQPKRSDEDKLKALEAVTRSKLVQAIRNSIRSNLEWSNIASYTAAVTPAYVAYTLATRGRSALGLPGLLESTIWLGFFPAWISSVWETDYRCAGLDLEELQQLSLQLGNDTSRQSLSHHWACGIMLGVAFIILKRPVLPPLVPATNTLDRWQNRLNRLFDIVVFVPLAGGSLGALVYYGKRSAAQLGIGQPVGAPVPPRVQHSKTRLGDKPLYEQIEWARDYLSIQLRYSTIFAFTSSLLALPIRALIELEDWSIMHKRWSVLMLKPYVRQAALCAGYGESVYLISSAVADLMLPHFAGLLIGAPAVHSALVAQHAPKATRFRSDPAYSLWSQYIGYGAVAGGSLIPPLVIKCTPASFKRDFMREGRFLYSTRNLMTLGGAGMALGGGLGSLAFIASYVNVKN